MWKPTYQNGCNVCAPIGNLRLNTRRAEVLLKFLQGHRISIGQDGGQLLRIPLREEYTPNGLMQYDWNDREENRGFMPQSKAAEILSFLQYAAAATDELKRTMMEVYSTKDSDVHHHHPDGHICYPDPNGISRSTRSIDLSTAQLHANAVTELENTLVWLKCDVKEALAIELVTRPNDNAIDMMKSCFTLTMHRENDPHSACDEFALDAPVTQTFTLEHLMKHIVHSCAWLDEKHDEIVRNLESVHV
jgi:hypothetical protein